MNGNCVVRLFDLSSGFDGWSVMMRSIVSSRSLTDPSSARSCAFSVVRSLIRSAASLSLAG
jgi:hypothetical protein